MTAINGTVEPDFRPVADAFARNFAAKTEIGAAVAVYLDGRKVVDLWAGVADRSTGMLWEADTRALVFSVSKGVVAVCVGNLVQEGAIALDTPVARYWPEFAAHGKSQITVRQMLSHRAGLSAVDRLMTRAELLEGRVVLEALADQRPLWEPGTGHAYHPITYGFLAGELIHRVTGLSAGEYFIREFAQPLGIASRFGIPERDQASLARLEPAPPMAAPAVPTTDADPQQRALTFGAIPSLDSPEMCFNDRDIRAVEMPATNLITDAADLAKFYAAVVTGVDGPPLLNSATIADMTVEQSTGMQAIEGLAPASLRWGTGFMLNSPPRPRMLGATSFGHDGAGGQLGFADVDAGIGFAYVNNRMGGPDDSRSNLLIEALGRCVKPSAGRSVLNNHTARSTP
jgi:CubicO group peptidase (beta-lactamase class C family)